MKSPLAETWDGTAWTITPAPPSIPESQLSGVSCLSATACVAVGRSLTAAGNQTLAEAWNGVKWSVQPTPDPDGSSALSAVSCTSSTACTAAGTSSAGVFAAVWYGTTWTVHPMPLPAGATRGTLLGVSCSAPTACTAVGTRLMPPGGRTGTLAEAWDGTTWTVPPTPISSATVSFSGVSCTSATACEAVGSKTGGPGMSPLAEVWHGTAWTVQPTQAPSNTHVFYLSGVSCFSGPAGRAVGSNWLHWPQTSLTLIERHS